MSRWTDTQEKAGVREVRLEADHPNAAGFDVGKQLSGNFRAACECEVEQPFDVVSLFKRDEVPSFSANAGHCGVEVRSGFGWRRPRFLLLHTAQILKIFIFAVHFLLQYQ